MRIRRLIGLGLLLALGVVAGYAQKLPSFHPSYVNHFNQENIPFSNTCFRAVNIDHRGRMWLNVCGKERLINSIGLFQYDGYQFQPVELYDEEGALFFTPVLKGSLDNGQMYGLGGGYEFFTFNPDSRVMQRIPFADSSHQQMTLSGFDKLEGTVYVMGYSKDGQIHLFRLAGGQLVDVLTLDYSTGVWGTKNYPLVVDEAEYWLMGGTFPLFRIDQKSGKVRKYGLEDVVTPDVIKQPRVKVLADQKPVLFKKKNGSVYLYLPDYYGNRFLEFDRQEDHFVSMHAQFPAGWKPQHLFQDESGNLCFLFKDRAGQYRAVLEDEQGKRYDYSAVIERVEDIRQLSGKDFQRQLFAVGAVGLYSIGVREEQLVRQVMAGKWVSAMAPLPDGRLLVNTVKEGWFVYDEQEQRSYPFVGPDCGLAPRFFARGMKQQIIPDQQGHLWMIARNYLLEYDPATQSCRHYDLGRQARLFAFVRDDLVAVQFGQFNLGFYDFKQQKIVDFGPDIPREFSGFIRDLHCDSRGLLWVLTNNGLWRFDTDQRSGRRYGIKNGFADIRFTAIYEDEKGILWLGTYYGGLHRFDPLRETVGVIDQRQGLSNNAIMSILPDEEGILWVGTEYGINIISPQGEVQHVLYEEDGLAYNKLERFDPLRFPDGRLLFGSRNGVSIIYPEGVKGSLEREQSLQLYLTELSYFDKDWGRERTRQDNLVQLGTIELPAEHPGIHLRFALSSYLEPQKNRYAYKIEGKDEEWHYLGNRSELHLNRLPAGRYRLLIKGADFRNNWMEAPLAIPIHAREFFYKQWWFYLLLALPFAVFGLIWARNKQLEARRLELEVARRTEKINAQAQQLRQLDELKTRFFTNISHELRTPVTLIKAPLEDLLQKHAATLEQRLVKRLQLILRNTGKLGRLVEELLELSRLEAKKAKLDEKPVALVRFCRQLFSAYASAADMKQIDYTFHADLPEEQPFWIDPGRLEKILNNLLSNALKFTPSKGQVWLKLYSSDSELIMEVQDDGPGIAAEDVPYVFDRFYQSGKKNAQSAGGSGIGLALSRELAELMEGTLSVESGQGQGALFRLRIPAKPADPAITQIENGEHQPAIHAVSAQAVFKAPTARTDTSDKRKLLLVEDNVDMQELLHSLLSEQYDCQIAPNGAIAWQWLSTKDPAIADIELIISDVMMPEMDGYTLLEKVKAHEDWQQLPVIMLTARAAEEDKLQALRMGVDDYLLKPFSPMELQARVRNLLHNYQVKTSVRESVLHQEREVEFEEEVSADQAWLQQVEMAAKGALEKQIKLNTSYLANKVFLSERQFSRRLKSATGLSPIGYIQEVKLQRARHLLESRAYGTVNEVAAACGYSSGSYLAKVFQERFGRTPGDYLT